MPLQFAAYSALRNLRAGLSRYLLDEFKVRQPTLATQLLDVWNHAEGPESLVAEPIYEAAFPHAQGGTLAEIEMDPHARRVAEGLVHGNPLFSHQIEAITEGRKGKTVVVSAGTGAGKTEAFLLPLLDRLYRDHASGADDLTQPGIRAILVYPLNALVNNQIDRIQDMLCKPMPNVPALTFAHYTGQLPEIDRGQGGGIAVYEAQYGTQHPAQRLVSREAIRNRPPHILVTNFAMLQRLLVRPADYKIFEPAHLFHRVKERVFPRLKILVLDEAHAYAGAQAAEIHMLLRRTADRFGTSLGVVQGFATSATLTSGDAVADGGSLEEFAAHMFGTTLDRVHCARGIRVPPTFDADSAADPMFRLPSWETLAPLAQAVEDLSTLVLDANGTPIALRENIVAVDDALRACVAVGACSKDAVDSARVAAKGRPALALHHCLRRSARVAALATRFESARVHSIAELAAVAYPDALAADLKVRAGTALLLHLASLARAEATAPPLLAIRVHAFVRAPVGAWVDLRHAASDPFWPWLYTSMRPPRRRGAAAAVPTVVRSEANTLEASAPDAATSAEIFGCDDCGHPFIGRFGADVWPQDTHNQGGTADVIDARGRKVFCPWPADGTVRAGADHGLGVLRVQGTPEVSGLWYDVRPEEEGKLRLEVSCACPACGARGVPLRPIRMPTSGATGVIVELLLPYLPAMAGSDGKPAQNLPAEGRRLLTMADSRQGAAHLAPNLASSHDRILGRQILSHAIESYTVEEAISLESLADVLVGNDDILRCAEARDLVCNAEHLSHADCAAIRRAVARTMVWRELASPPHNAPTLQHLGHVEIMYPGLARLPLPQDSGLGDLTEAEWRDFVATILDEARARGVATLPTIEAERPKGTWYSPIESDLPTAYQRDLILQRIDPKVLEQLQEHGDEDGSDNVATLLAVTAARPRSRTWCYAQAVAEMCNGQPDRMLILAWEQLSGQRIDGKPLMNAPFWGIWRIVQNWESSVRISIRTPDLKTRWVRVPPFVDAVTGRPYYRSVRGVVPGLSGRRSLRPTQDLDLKALESRHAHIRAHLNAQLDHALYTEEHTAQNSAEANIQIEREFRTGRVNLLSTSTTMEMGIDLGGLTAVLMTNVPPGPANYWQRAGRAGRRAEGSSLALVLCQSRLHDQQVFEDPLRFMTADISVPRVILDSEVLLLRHVRAHLLASFFRLRLRPTRGNVFGRVGAFFNDLAPANNFVGTPPSPDVVPATAFEQWLLSYVGRDVQEEPLRSLCVLVDGTCLAGVPPMDLIQDTVVAMRNIARTYAVDTQTLVMENAAIETLEEEDHVTRADARAAVERRRERLIQRSLLDYLVENDFLPRFAFPTDIARLATPWHDARIVRQNGVRAVSLERDLDRALAEYAPGAKVVASGWVFESRGLSPNFMAGQRFPWRHRFAIQCTCSFFKVEDTPSLLQCPVCATKWCATKWGSIAALQAGDDDVLEHAQKVQDYAIALDDGFGRERLEALAARRRHERHDPTPRWRSFLQPTGFSTGFHASKNARYVGSRTMTRGSARIKLMPSPDVPRTDWEDGVLRYAWTPGASLYVRAEGKPDGSGTVDLGYGFALCVTCGRAAPESKWARQANEDQAATALPMALHSHRPLYGRGQNGMCTPRYHRNVTLGYVRRVDALRVVVGADVGWGKVSAPISQTLAFTLAALLVPVVARELQLDPRDLSPAVVSAQAEDGSLVHESALYEVAGAGGLKRIADRIPALVHAAVELAFHGTAIDLVRYDNQFTMSGATVDLDMFRAHFTEDRRARLDRREAHIPGARIVPGWPIVSRAIEILHDTSVVRRAPLMITRRIEPVADVSADLISACRRRALSDRPVRLILAADPRVLGDRMAAVILHRAVQDGVQVRIAMNGETAFDTPWRMSGAHLGKPCVIGGARPGGVDVEAAVDVLGSGWLQGHRLLVSTDIEAHERVLENAWDRAIPIDAVQLRRDVEDNLVELSKGQFLGEGVLAASLTPRIGALRALGPVREVIYEDIYFPTRMGSMAAFARALAEFDMPRGVPITVHFGTIKDPDGASVRVGANFRAVDALVLLYKNVSEQARQNLADELMDKFEWNLRLQAHKRHLPHRRKLTVRFQHGKELQICLDKGFDWLNPVGPISQDTQMLPGALPAAAWEVREDTFFVIVKRPTE